MDTGLIRHLDPAAIRAAGASLLDPEQQLKSVAQGAATSVWCATSPLLDGSGGVYCENCDISPVVTADGEAAWRASSGIPGVLPYAVDAAAAARLWEISAG
jgi:hypothetical protein